LEHNTHCSDKNQPAVFSALTYLEFREENNCHPHRENCKRHTWGEWGEKSNFLPSTEEILPGDFVVVVFFLVLSKVVGHN
jgi:hypothetical protein